ncbi:MAG: PHP domain-containing protein [Planctomycetes bacterium]|uniref:TrlF family AAA-like ATPase n=1 Tax=Candidatus Wunengus sp. YC65 TaxID=3367701 RepID=UPI001DA0009B|nr:PHP domain-containing protein [Planctomycetota bacterium]
MNIIEEINLQEDGAKFRRCDLHIHSFGGSYEVTDSSMTPQNIVDLAIENKLEIIAITDHNSIDNVEQALEYAQGKNIYVVPGIELTTLQGHLLLYFETYQSLKSFFGKVNISDDKKYCKGTISQCLELTESFGGLGIAAHIDTKTGFELMQDGYSPHKAEILKSKNLLALEISEIDNLDWYTKRDSNNERRRLLNERNSKNGFNQNQELAKVLFSDSHTLSGLGKNAKGDNKVTRFKMDSLNFHSLKIALMDSTARVRLEDLIPATFPYFKGIRYEGGFLNSQVIKFNRNLTCIIGGRGTGKSTALESVRCTSGNTAREQLIDSEVWPDKISLIYCDEVGNEYLLNRDKYGEVVNMTDPQNGPVSIPIESYGQGETAETIQHCSKDPKILLKFLDDFCDFGDLNDQEELILQKLLDNQTTLEKLQIEVKQLPDYQKNLQYYKKQLEALKKEKAVDIIKLQESLTRETSLRNGLLTKIDEKYESISDYLKIADLIEELNSYDENSLVVGKKEFIEIKKYLSDFGTLVDDFSNKLEQKIKELSANFKAKILEWKNKEAELIKKIEEKKIELEKQGIKLDMGFIKKVTKDVTDYETKIKELNKKTEILKTLKTQRKQLNKERFSIKNKKFTIRNAVATELNKNLESIISDFHVKIKFREGLLSPELSDILQETMGWRTSQVPKANLISNHVTVPKLLSAVGSKDSTAVLNITDKNDQKIFSKKDVTEILDRLSDEKVVFKIERCFFEDLPEIIVTKEFVNPEDPSKKEYISRDFSKLSLGQQQSVLLSILLFSKSKYPLVIDQPEDNLDSEFIYHTLVQHLRVIKERRQIIIATHNANITVLGDAELIIPLKSTSEKGIITNRGSIDSEETRKITCKILEGSEEAFKKRAEIYGIN